MRIQSRTYGGLSTAERRADRRRRLIDAALEIWGDQGWAAVTMRGVCSRAALTDRYFYEQFSDRDALLAAVWDQVRDDTLARTAATFVAGHPDPLAQLRAAITAVVEVFTGDPRLARIIFGEHAGSPVLQQRRHDTIQAFTDLIITVGRPYFRPDTDETSLRVSTLMGVGGFVELLTAWLADTIPLTPDQLITHATNAGASLATRYLTT